MIDEGEYLSSLRSIEYHAGFLASLAIAAWGATTGSDDKRRANRMTSFPTISRETGRDAASRRRGPINGRSTSRARSAFRVSVLTAGDDRRLTLYVHAGWVRTAIEQIDQSRAAAGLSDRRQRPDPTP